MKVTNANIGQLLAHVRAICTHAVEVREVSVSQFGVCLSLDTVRGIRESEIVMLSCTPTDPEAGEKEGGWKITARLNEGKLVGDWVAQGEDMQADWRAAWFSVMANRTGCGEYWLELLEVDA